MHYLPSVPSLPSPKPASASVQVFSPVLATAVTSPLTFSLWFVALSSWSPHPELCIQNKIGGETNLRWLSSAYEKKENPLGYGNICNMVPLAPKTSYSYLWYPFNLKSPSLPLPLLFFSLFLSLLPLFSLPTSLPHLSLSLSLPLLPPSPSLSLFLSFSFSV